MHTPHLPRACRSIAKDVKQWAESTGAKCLRMAEAFKCVGAVSTIEALLSTELSHYAHTSSGRKVG